MQKLDNISEFKINLPSEARRIPEEGEEKALRKIMDKELSLEEYFLKFDASLEAAGKLISNRIFKDELDPKEQRQWLDMYLRLRGQYKQRQSLDVSSISWEE